MTDTPSTSTPTEPAERSFRHSLTREPGARAVLDVEVEADRLTRQSVGVDLDLEDGARARLARQRMAERALRGLGGRARRGGVRHGEVLV